MPQLDRSSATSASNGRWSGHRYWHIIYYVLAAMVVAVICGGLYLNQHMTALYGQSVTITQHHADLLASFLDLGDLAQEVNAPANDLFSSRATDMEQARYDVARAAFEQQMASFRHSLAEDQALAVGKFILRAIDQVAASMGDMNQTAQQVFVRYRAGQFTESAAALAEMNRAYAGLTRKIAEASRTIQDMQFAAFHDQLGSVQRHTRQQYIVGAVIMLIVGAVVFYGHRIKGAMTRVEAERLDLVERLEQSEALATGRLHDAIESIDEGFVLYDRDDRLVLCNSRYRHIYAASADFMQPGASFERILREGLAHGQYGKTSDDPAWIEQRLELHRRADGAIEQELGDGSWLLATDRRTREGGIVGIRRDITDRKRSEVALREANERLTDANNSLQAAMARLSQQERLAALGQLAGTVSHELRNPLGAIRASVELIRRTFNGQAPNLDRAFDRVERNIGRCDDLVSDLLDYARQKELRRQDVLIDHWLNDMLDEQFIDPAVTVVRDFRSGAQVGFDPEKLRRVVVNLVDNAVQAMLDPEWKAPADRPRRVTLRTDVAGSQLRLSVIDTGPGIPEDRRARIFEPLFTTKGFGVGLGLPIVQQIVEQHGGAISVDSSPDGTCFTIALPRQAATRDQAA